MDVTFTTKFDVKQYARDIKRALAFLFQSLKVFYWCLLMAWLVIMFALWLAGWPEDWETLAWSFPFFVVCVGISRRFMAFAYVRQVQRMIGNDALLTCRMTDNGYETICGDLVQKLPWQNIATSYHFLDDDTVSFMLRRVGVVMVLSDLRKHGVGRGELEEVLRKAGLLPAGRSKVRKAVSVISILLGTFLVVVSLLYACAAVVSCRSNIRLYDTQIRLFDLIHGKEDSRRPPPFDPMRTKVVQALMDVRGPDEFAYVFDPEDENDKVGLFARYGDWSCAAYYPCGCVREHEPGYWATMNTNSSSTVYLEADKEKWLKKVRPLAKELYEDEDE